MREGVRVRYARDKISQNDVFCCGIQIKAVPLHRISKKCAMETYRTPEAYISDIEILTGKSNRTAQRIMAQIRKEYGIDGRKRPTLLQVKSYLVKIATPRAD